MNTTWWDTGQEDPPNRRGDNSYVTKWYYTLLASGAKNISSTSSHFTLQGPCLSYPQWLKVLSHCFQGYCKGKLLNIDHTPCSQLFCFTYTWNMYCFCPTQEPPLWVDCYFNHELAKLQAMSRQQGKAVTCSFPSRSLTKVVQRQEPVSKLLEQSNSSSFKPRFPTFQLSNFIPI